jgi:enoyl-CoA hydratase
MSEGQIGCVRTETHGHVLKIIIDNPAKMNAFHPDMMEKLSDALTLLDRTPNLRVGVLCAEGKHFTAGLDMPKFFGPTATVKERAAGNIDPFALANRCRKPIVTAVQGVVYTVGIEMMLAGDIVIAADDCHLPTPKSTAICARGKPLLSAIRAASCLKSSLCLTDMFRLLE